MTPDDIHDDHAASSSSTGKPSRPPATGAERRREIGPESEVRGGPEAPDGNPATPEEGLPEPLDPAVKG